MLELININKKFKERIIFNDLSYKFNDKGIYLINGYNGCGKTTLLNIIAMIDCQYFGEIIINGQNYRSYNSFARYSFRKNNIDYITTKDNLLSFMTLKQNLFNQDKEIDLSLVDGINLDKYPSKISGGQKILVALTRAFNSKKDILLLDEVTSQLDDAHTELVIKKIEENKNKKLIIFVSHDTRILNRYSNHILKINEGRI